MNYTKPRTPSAAQLEAIKRRHEVKDGNLIVKSRDKTKIPKVGTAVGTINTQGHLSVGVMGDKFRCHHIVYFLTNGTWPNQPIHHLNGCKTDKSVDNITMIGTKPQQDAAEAGEKLNEVKAILKHGDFKPWIIENCDFGERTAQRYMKCAKVKYDTQAHKQRHAVTS